MPWSGMRSVSLHPDRCGSATDVEEIEHAAAFEGGARYRGRLLDEASVEQPHLRFVAHADDAVRSDTLPDRSQDVEANFSRSSSEPRRGLQGFVSDDQKCVPDAHTLASSMP